MSARSALAVLWVLYAPGVSWAAATAPLPEPGVVELLAVSAVAGIAVAIRNRRK